MTDEQPPNEAERDELRAHIDELMSQPLAPDYAPQLPSGATEL